MNSVVEPRRVARPTLVDVAKRCKLSKATVSKALSLPVERCPVRATTRQRILRVADEMGYRPNWRAKSLADGKSHTIGLLYGNAFPHLTGVYEAMLRTFAAALQRERYHLALVPVTEGRDEWRHVLAEQRLDGYVVLEWLSDPLRRAFDEEPLPGVLLNIETDYPMSQVMADDRGGAEMAVNHLLELGHRRIAFFFGSGTTHHYSVQHRQEGYESSVRRAGLAAQVTRAPCDEFAHALRENPDAPTAIIAYSHVQAVELLPALWRHGIQVPRDVSLLAFNDVYPMEYLMPPVTAIAVPSEQIAAVAAEVLLQQIAAPQPLKWRRIVLPEELVPRQSTAPPRRR